MLAVQELSPLFRLMPGDKLSLGKRVSAGGSPKGGLAGGVAIFI